MAVEASTSLMSPHNEPHSQLHVTVLKGHLTFRPYSISTAMGVRIRLLDVSVQLQCPYFGFRVTLHLYRL